jgi:hypothetical protein
MDTAEKNVMALLDDRNEAGPETNAERAVVNLRTSSPKCTTKERHDM